MNWNDNVAEGRGTQIWFTERDTPITARRGRLALGVHWSWRSLRSRVYRTVTGAATSIDPREIGWWTS